jgi:transaldolase
VLSSQRWVRYLTAGNEEPTKLIAASLRNPSQLDTLAGVNVFTMPTKVARGGKKELSGDFIARLEVDHPVGTTGDARRYFLEKAWEVTPAEEDLARDLAGNLPRDGEELIRRARDAGAVDMFPELSREDSQFIADDGKIPVHERWASRIAAGEMAIDTLLNLAGLASFATDQAALDERIKNIIQ